MKKSLFKKIIAITLSLTLVLSCMMVAMPYVHAADVEYYYDADNKAIGIKSITVDGVKYFDVVGNGSVTIDDLNEAEFFKMALNTKNDDGYSALELWSTLAAKIFADNNGYSSDMLIGLLGGTDAVDLPQLLRQEQEYVDPDGAYSTTGLRYATSLSAAQTLMAEEMLKNGKHNVYGTVEEILENCAHDNESIYDTDDKPGYKLLNNETGQTVLTSTVVMNSFSTKAYSSANAFGIAFYDFQLVPLAGSDIKYITAADGHASLEEAANAGIAGVSYNETGTGKANTMYTSNPAMSEATVEIGYEESTSTSVSNFMESTKTYSFSESFESSTKFELGFPFLTNGEQTLTFGFTAEQAISTAYGSEDSYTESSTVSSRASVVLPAHTQIGITQQTGKTEMMLDYECPAYLTYKVAIFSMYNTSLLPALSAPRGNGGMITVFGTDNSIGGLNAVDNLEKRVANKGFNGFERAQGNFFASRWDTDDGASIKYEADWNSILSSMDTPVAESSDITMRNCIDGIPAYIPFSSAGATISMTTSSINNNVSGIVPLYDLDYIQTDGNSVYTIAPGGTLDFSKIATAGYNAYDVPYYGYVSDGGEWVLCDADGNELTTVDGVTMQTVSEYEKLTAEKVGTYYAKFKINEDSYNKVDGSGKIANADLSSTAIVTINVTETGLDHICTEGPWVTTITPSCTSAGEQCASCKTCGRVMYTQALEKTDHIPVAITTPATCHSEGSEKEICGKCLTLISSEVIDKLSHEFGYESITREPTCIANGEKSLYCAICNQVYATEQIEKSGHGTSVHITAIQPTCTLPGEKQEICADCNALIGTQDIDPLEHKPGKWEITKDATCTQSGLKQRSCAYCDMLLDEEVIEPHEHEYSDWYKNNDGTHSKTCSICKDIVTNNCRYDSKVDASTCLESGITTHVCEICSYTYTDAYTEALGHLWGEWNADANGEEHTRECLRDNCDATETHTHNWSDWTDNKDNKVFCNGTKTRTCLDCGQVETEEAEHTTFFGRVFYPVIVFFGNIAHKIIWIFSLNWLFPELTITPQI